ncbi:MAG: AAA family ATPase [bacterium]|nr:AAA family ATPase [bacterium]
METYQPERKPIFVTFYSFKGGVGRTMAMVNAACILAGRGRRVLMIDFDLEAPGLTMLALKQLASPTQPPPAGLVDLIYDVLTDPANSALADKENPDRYTEYVCSLNIPKHLLRIEGGKLDLMPCGRLDAGYEERLYAIDFDELYAEGIGQPIFKHLRNLIRDSRLYDYILIDSRTGFSDEGGISTRDLAEHIVVLTGLNRQNIEGTVRFLTRLKASGWQEGKVQFILSPIPTGYEELRAERTAYAKKEIEEKTGFKADFDLYIPYHPRLALDEEPFVYNWTGTDLFSAYKSVYNMLQKLAGDTSSVWIQRLVKAVQDGRSDEDVIPYLLPIQADMDDPLVAASMVLFFETLMDRKKLSNHVRAETHVILGQMRLESLNDAAGAVENAEAALKIFRAEKVHTQSTKNAEVLLQKAKERLK